ncbi:MAG: AMP-binding protein [Acetobacteraceae bacterium]|nr:AMP-binding protein [Acetobacteraceae bacterium]
MHDLSAAIRAALALPGWRAHLAGAAPETPLEALPVLRKADLPALQKGAPPFGGFAAAPATMARLFASPGPIFEGVTAGPDPWRFAPALRAAGIGAGDVLLNCFGYHLTPGGFIFDEAARALGCAVIPAGPSGTQQIVEAIAAYRPTAYSGTPDFLKILIEACDAAGLDVSALRAAVVTGAAFPPSLRDWAAARGIRAVEAYGTAELGLIAWREPGGEGMRVADGLILEVVRPGTGDPLPEGEVGELLVTIPDPAHPVLRFSPGDLTARLPGGRIRGWMGRADQTVKVRGMFVRPEQVAEIARAHPGLGRLRLVVTREGESDEMTLLAEGEDAAGLEATIRAATKLRGRVEMVARGSLPADGKVIEDRRPVA